MAEIFRENPAIRQLKLPFTPRVQQKNEAIIAAIPTQVIAYEQQCQTAMLNDQRRRETAAVAKKAAEFLDTPEGKASMDQVLENARQLSEKICGPSRRARSINLDDVYGQIIR